MSSLVDFLRARLDEDEAAARAHGETGPMCAGHLTGGPLRRRRPCRVCQRDRALREVEAHRRIIQQHDAWPVLVEGTPKLEQHTDPTDLQGITFRMSQQMAWLTTREYVARFGADPPTTPMLRALAGIYADHPDYDPTWEQPGGVT